MRGIMLNAWLKQENGRDKRRFFGVGVLFLSAILLTICGSVGCSRVASAPKEYANVDRAPDIYPDYRDVVVPKNIAPLNFDLAEESDRLLTLLYVAPKDSKGDDLKPIASFSGKNVRFKQKFWKKTLEENVGASLRFAVFAKKEGKWSRFKDWTMEISPDLIDSWVSYRLIAPGYEHYSDLAIMSRNVETFEERSIFRARLANERTCINCHSFQNYRTDAFLFHMRLTDGGTVFKVGDDVVKRDLQADGLDAGCSYPAWRPNSLHVAFSSNQTFQVFRTKSPDRIDVLDSFSDLYLYDVVKNELKAVVPPGDDYMQTYPSWSSDGKFLYYCAAKNPGFTTSRENYDERKVETMNLRDKIKYDVMRVSFDEKSGRFGAPEKVFDAVARNMSALFPRVSPDGKTLLVTTTAFGCFPIWYRDSNLWAVDLTSGEARALDEINAPKEPDSYHSWSSSGKWIVFSSRRDDGLYTRLYFSRYDDASGRFSKPIMLPQKRPVQTLELARSFNVPEFTIEPVDVPRGKLLKEAKKTTLEKPTLAR